MLQFLKFGAVYVALWICDFKVIFANILAVSVRLIMRNTPLNKMTYCTSSQPPHSDTYDTALKVLMQWHIHGKCFTLSDLMCHMHLHSAGWQSYLIQELLVTSASAEISHAPKDIKINPKT